MKKQVICVLTAVALTSAPLCITATGCAQNVGSDVKVITVGTMQSIEYAVRDEYDYDVLASGVSEMPLVGKDARGQYYSVVADFATTDSKAWTFTVKDNLKWSDGEEVTAEDIVFSLIYEGESDKKIVFSQTNETAKYESYVLSDDKTSVTLNLKTANVKELSEMTTFRIRPKHVYEGKKETELTQADKRVTCGPYKLADYNKEAGAITFEKNEYYPEETNFDKVVYRLFKDADVMYIAFMRGELDYVWQYSSSVPADYQKVVRSSENIELVSVPAENCPAMLVFNNKTGLFADKNLRLAVSYALNYENFNKYFGSEYATLPNKSFVPDTHLGYKDTGKLVHDTDRASEYMLAAGYEKKGGVWEKDGRQAHFTLTVNASSRNPHLSYADFVKTQLEEFGIKVTLDAIDSTNYNAKATNRFSNNNVTTEAAIFGFTAFGMNGLGVDYINGNDAVQGGGQVFSDELDEIENRLSSATSLEEYIAAAGELQDFYASEMPAIALYWDSFVYAYADRLENVFADAVFGINNVKNWSAMTKKGA